MKRSTTISIAMVILLPIAITACGKAVSETVEEILSQTANVSLMKYDCVWNRPERTQTSRVWVKDNMMRIEQTKDGQPVETYLCDYDEMTSLHWTPPENVLKLSVTPREVGDFFSAMYMASAEADHNPSIIGIETLDRKNCIVIECVSGGLKLRLWIWKQHKFLVRHDIIGTEYTVTIEFKNIDFGNIPDSMFELPEIP